MNISIHMNLSKSSLDTCMNAATWISVSIPISICSISI